MRARRAVAAAMMVALAAAGCGHGAVVGDAARRSPASSPSVGTSPSPHSTPSLTESPAASFRASISAIDAGARDRMVGSSWHPGCPVAISDLRLVRVDFVGFDGAVHPGELVVNASAARAVVAAFRALFRARFPIRRMEPVDAFGGDDGRSMAADNTSGFNCRAVTGHPGVWSEHAYGLAVDVDPLENPYVAGGSVQPPAGARFVDRSRRAPGMIHDGDAVVRAFAAVGWGWGGTWTGAVDYQHFSANGR